jgi:hypothetical protein
MTTRERNILITLGLLLLVGLAYLTGRLAFPELFAHRMIAAGTQEDFRGVARLMLADL